jgi:5-deoxy-glucuronate isomerase
MTKEKKYSNDPKNWKYTSPDKPGFFTIISPENSVCKATWIFRLNLTKDSVYRLHHNTLEFSTAVIAGSLNLTYNGQTEHLQKLDSFYLPAGKTVELLAKEDLILYIGGGPCEGVGKFFIRRMDFSIPIGEIHQVHGEPPYQRQVFMAVNQEVPASRLITGFTWGEEGKWTSWPPHQHSKDLEEVYCYFDIPAPKFALHLASTKPGMVDAVHPVSSGDCVAIPEGYHPTVGIPGMKSCYFWVMVAHSQKSRRYDLAINDPNFE